LERFPRHRYSERAAWKAGWFAYRNKRYGDTAEIFDRAAATFPRADYRPSWLYWSGRAHDHRGDAVTATARYRLAVADYQNSYYGRLAEEHLRKRAGSRLPASAAPAASAGRGTALPAVNLPATAPPATPPPVANEAAIRGLIAAG